MQPRLFGRGDPPDRRAPVRWFDPRVLAVAGLDVGFSAYQNRYLDRRESYGVPKLTGAEPEVDFRAQPGEFWFDYVADTGDGGNATYSVLHTMLRSELHHGAQALPRGRLLVLGGDLAYPQASSEEYQYRFVDLFMAANRGATQHTEAIVALPANHDWYDNLSTFSRYFVAEPDPAKPLKRFANGIPVAQRASYFLIALPHRWWIAGLDLAFTGDIDRNQYEAFVAWVDQRLEPDAKVILVYPEPFWNKDERSTRNVGRPKRYQRLEARIGIERIRLRLAGDMHHFSDVATTDGDARLVGCGTGGAFMHPTHVRDVAAPKIERLEGNELAIEGDQDKFVRVRADTPGRRAAAQARATIKTRRYEPVLRYPSPQESRTQALLLPVKFGWLNPEFALSLGLFYWLSAWLNGFLIGSVFGEVRFPPIAQYGLAGFGADALVWLQAMVFYMPSALLNFMMIGLFVLFSRKQQPVFAIIGGVAHGLAHTAAVFVLYWSAVAVGLAPSNQTLSLALWGLAVIPWMWLGGAVVGSIIFGIFLWIAVRFFGQHQEESFAALRIEDYKGFLRFRIDASGALTGYFVQIDRVCRRWNRMDDPNAPLWSPAGDQSEIGEVRHVFRVQ